MYYLVVTLSTNAGVFSCMSRSQTQRLCDQLNRNANALLYGFREVYVSSLD